MKKFSITLLIMLFALMAKAQEVINPPTEGLYGGINGDSQGVVGAIGGTVDVSALGGATYTIPIQIPDGVCGMQPNLSIVYNSQSGNGLLGWGWNLGGLSAITRIGTTSYHDRQLSGVDFQDDRFALDGQRLIVVKGSYGSDGSEYKTEVDGLSKIVAYSENGIVNGPGWFTVHTADGMILEYGMKDARMAFDAEEQGKKEVGIWMLRRVIDRNGNYLEYHYAVNEDSYRLKDIQYTKNNSSGLNSFYGIDFHYYGEIDGEVERVDSELSFIGSHALCQPWLLKNISVYHWRQPLYEYEFVYCSDYGIEESAYFYNKLSEIRLVYENGMEYNSTYIKWDGFPNINNGNFNFHNGYISFIEPDNLDHYAGQQKFSGDFNGDGLSDFISIYNDSKKETTYAQPFINKGNTKAMQSSGKVWFEKRGRLLSFKNYQLCWIYVCDFDGDGMDDFYFMSESKNNLLYKQVHIYACKSYLDDEGNWSYRMIKFYNGLDCEYYSTNVGNRQHVTMMTGDFMGRGKADVVFQKPTFIGPEPFGYFEYRNGKIMVNWANDFNNNGQLRGDNYVCGDFDCDGMTEIWMSGAIYKIKKVGQWFYEYEYVHDINIPGGGIVYIGDFNGDGCPDFLSFNENAGEEQNWKIHITHKTGAESPTTYNISQLMNSLTGGLNPYYGHLLETQSNMQYYLDIADMNGDGKSDIVIINGSNNMHILYTPVFEKVAKDGRMYGQFAFHEEIFDAGNTGIGNNSSNTNISARCSGNFLGQENQSILDAVVFSKSQLSTYYNAKAISDGMGNTAVFEYGYLINNPKKPDDRVYTLSNVGEDIGNGKGIYHTPLPMLAVKKVENYNTFDRENEDLFSVSKRYSYTNAIIHKFGRGFLGFAETEVANDVSGVCQSIVRNESSIEPMGCNCMAVPIRSELLDGNRNRKSESDMLYYKARNLSDTIIFAPLVFSKQTCDYETGNPQNALRTTLELNYYQSDRGNSAGLQYESDFEFDRPVAELAYENTFNCPNNSTMVGKGKLNILDFLLFGASEFTNSSITTFTPDDYVNWVINRPATVKTIASRKGDEYSDKSSLTAYKYEYPNNPFLPSKVSVYPNGIEDDNDEFGTYTKYEYDYMFGHVVNTTFQDTRRQLRPQKTEYVYNRIEGHYTNPGRFLVKETTYPNGQPLYETNYEYEEVWGTLLRTTDCRGNYVKHTPDPMGVRACSREMYYGDIGGTESYTETLWAGHAENGSWVTEEDAPNNALYYSWSQEGIAEDGEAVTSPEIKTYYDGAGRVLRTVTTDVLGNVVYSDTKYDNYGNVSKVYDPYFKGTEGDAFTTYSYDAYQRNDKITYPDGTERNIVFDDGFTTTTEYQGQKTKTEVNIVGWTVTNSDFITENNVESEIPVSYDYYSDGSLWTASAEGSGTITLTYDAAGNRYTLSDPDYGLTTTTYNAYGELIEQATPKGCTTSYAYDGMGRIKTRNEIDQNNVAYSTEWFYSPESWNLGLLEQINYNKGMQVIKYKYNSRLLPEMVEESRNFGSENYVTKYEYDGFGRTEYVTYPSLYRIQRVYEYGHLKEIHGGNGQSLWNTIQVNAQGQIEKFDYGNGIESEYTYDPVKHYLKNQTAKINDEIIQSFAYEYDNFRNLRHRNDRKHCMKEEFQYDDLNRLTHIFTNGVESEMNYDHQGRLEDKEVNGISVFSAAQYDPAKPHQITGASVPADTPILRTNIEYTMFDKVENLRRDAKHIIRWEYGYDHQRIEMTQFGLAMTLEKKYVDNCEFVKIMTDDYMQKSLTYLSGPMGVFAVVEKDVESNDFSVNYIHKDHLGSWTAITDQDANVEQEVSYDAWGNLRNASDWSAPFDGKLLFDRGYTGHEHLYFYSDQFSNPYQNENLINMNGRMYDPIMSSFLSVDNYVSSPDFSQAFNRYAYCLNNPLKYTDPDGEFPWIPMLIGAGISVTTNGIDNLVNGDGFFKGAGKAALFGGIQGLCSFGIGQVASSISSAGARVAFQTIAHGSLGGVSSTLNGGTFAQGFVSGAASSLVATGMGGLTQDMSKFGQAIGTVGGGALAGGVGSTLCGGSFWDGFRNGAISSGLNHAVHTGVFGKGLMMASITGRTRHLFGPDAETCEIVADASAGMNVGLEVGGIRILQGPDKGSYPMTDLGIGAGTFTASVGLESVEFYSTESVVTKGDFEGARWETNGSISVCGISIGGSIVRSNHYDNNGRITGRTYGIGISIGFDAMPFNASVNVNYGGTTIGNRIGLRNNPLYLKPKD